MQADLLIVSLSVCDLLDEVKCLVEHNGPGIDFETLFPQPGIGIPQEEPVSRSNRLKTIAFDF